MTHAPLIAVTGASGQLGRLAIQFLLSRHPAARILAIARDPAKIADLAEAGVQVRQGDYDRPDTLDAALAGGLVIASQGVPVLNDEKMLKNSGKLLLLLQRKS